MFVKKILSISRPLVQRKALALTMAGEGARSAYVVSVPPRNKVANGELVVMGLILACSLWFTPFWVLYHLPDYQKEDRNQYTGK